MNEMLKPLIEVIEKGLNEAIKAVPEVIVPTIEEEGRNTVEGIKKDAKELWNEFIQKIKEQKAPTCVVAQNVEILDSSKLLDIAKENIVKGANEVYAMKKQKGDASFVYLAYGKDKEPFDKEHNKYVIIKAEALKSDVLSLFNGTELVILK